MWTESVYKDPTCVHAAAPHSTCAAIALYRGRERGTQCTSQKLVSSSNGVHISDSAYVTKSYPYFGLVVWPIECVFSVK